MSRKISSPERDASYIVGGYDANHHGGFHPIRHSTHPFTYLRAYITNLLPEFPSIPPIELHRLLRKH